MKMLNRPLLIIILSMFAGLACVSHLKEAKKDVNPILAITEKTFVLMEMNQTITRHTRSDSGVK